MFPAQADEIVAASRKDLPTSVSTCSAMKTWITALRSTGTATLLHGKQAPRKPWFKIKYLDFEEVGDSKITWELNRHQHFVTLAKAYRLTRRRKFAREILRAVDPLAQTESVSDRSELG